MKTFYMVMRNKPRVTIQARHCTEEAAVNEAERLCSLENDQFVVLKAILKVKPVNRPTEIEYATD